MNFIKKLPKWFESKPLVLLRFQKDVWKGLHNSSRGLSRFTIARDHQAFDEIKVPTLCLIELTTDDDQEFYVAVITSKDAVSTFDSRITVIKLQALMLESFEKLASTLATRKFQNALRNKLTTKKLALNLSPKLSTTVILNLARTPVNKTAIEKAAYHLPHLQKIRPIDWEQRDAVRTALAAFGLDKSASAENLRLSGNSDSTLKFLESHALEDNVIAADSTQIAGFKLMAKHVNGHAIFKKGGEQLDIYTANKGPLEHMLGVDLIYINEVVGNTVMVQCKMLEPSRNGSTTDWIFRPDDQLRKEMSRMKLPNVSGSIEDYRLHRNPFFFKFIKRKGDGISHQSFVIALNHLERMLGTTRTTGTRGGVRISYQDLDGAYLRESDMIGLIRSGYVGTHRVESEALNPIIESVANGNRALEPVMNLRP